MPEPTRRVGRVCSSRRSATAVPGLVYPLARVVRAFRPASRGRKKKTLQPVLHVLPQLFFRLIRRCERNPLAIQWDVMAGHVFRAVFLGNEVIEQALMASMPTHGVPVVGTGKRVLEDGSRPPRRAIPISIASLLQEVEFVA